MYEFTALFLYKPVFLLELLIAEGIFSYRLKRRKGFAWKASLCILACLGIAFALPILSYHSAYIAALFLVMFLSTLGAGLFLYDAPAKSVVLCALLGYTVQHVAHECFELFDTVTMLDGVTSDFYGSAVPGTDLFGSWTQFVGVVDVFEMTVYLSVYLVIYLTVWSFNCTRERGFDAEYIPLPTLLLLAAFVLLIDVFFGAMIIESLLSDADRTSRIMLHVYNIACCIVAVALLTELPRRKLAEHEADVISRIIKREHEQYRTSKETIALLNEKAHDLKHQLLRFRNHGMTSEEAAELENIIAVYDSTFRTCNDALNVVLTEKSIFCNKNGIAFTCLCEAEGLAFLSESDVYSLFGNIIDNAIEAVQGLDAEERAIELTVRTHGKFVNIDARNAYGGELDYEDGLPRTKKPDAFKHGYGLKSIRSIVKKYGGQMRIKAINHVFDLAILFQKQG